jgi:hypothetical protein
MRCTPIRAYLFVKSDVGRLRIIHLTSGGVLNGNAVRTRQLDYD